MHYLLSTYSPWALHLFYACINLQATMEGRNLSITSASLVTFPLTVGVLCCEPIFIWPSDPRWYCLISLQIGLLAQWKMIAYAFWKEA
jgi:hypothetical protein